MGYYLMPAAEAVEINIRLVVAEAIRVFMKSRKIVTDKQLHARFDTSQDVVTVIDPETGDHESYTLVELGFL